MNYRIHLEDFTKYTHYATVACQSSPTFRKEILMVVDFINGHARVTFHITSKKSGTDEVSWVKFSLPEAIEVYNEL